MCWSATVFEAAPEGGHRPLLSCMVGASGIGNLVEASVIATEPLGNDMYPLVLPGRGPVIVTRLAPNALMAAIVAGRLT